DGTFDINDVTMYQKALANMNVSTGSVIVNYLNKETNEKISKSVEYVGRVGETYEVPKASALGYDIDESQLPEASVTVPAGVKEINFYYIPSSSGVTINVKHSGDADWAPNLWIWGSKGGEDSGTNYCKDKGWPGDMLTEKDENGWYSESFTASAGDDSYNFIISKDSGSPQSTDCKGFGQNNIWVVIDDSKDGVNLLVYDVNPDNNKDAKPIFTT
ncbi:MAG: MucBP domain-containing protein, partial [Ruminococcus sp.]|nr:MucBP domain-containing protein [Ruminococcus sp.]